MCRRQMLTDKCFDIIINADLKYWNRYVHWEDTQKGNKTPLKGDGIPFIIMGRESLNAIMDIDMDHMEI